MVAKVMIESGYQPGTGIGLARQGEIKPVKLKKTVDRYGLGYKPTKQNKKRIAAEKQEKKLARLEGRDPVSPGLGEVPHISATFPKPAYVYQPQPFFFDEDEEEQYSEKVEELLVLAKKSRELKEVFEYYDIPEEAGHFIRAYKLQPSKTVQSLRFTVVFFQPYPPRARTKGSKYKGERRIIALRLAHSHPENPFHGWLYPYMKRILSLKYSFLFRADLKAE